MTHTKAVVPSKCLHCQSNLETPIVCAGCQTLYPLPDTVDYFDLFRLPRGYQVDADDLERKFLAISRNIHPDFFGNESTDMRQLAVRLSAELNEAVRVLKDPALRAAYLLEQAGGPNAADDRSVPQQVLAETMMFREEVEEAAGDPQVIAQVKEQVTRRREQALERIAQLADSLDQAGSEEKTELRRLLNSIKYYDNLLAEMPSPDMLRDSRDRTKT